MLLHQPEDIFQKLSACADELAVFDEIPQQYGRSTRFGITARIGNTIHQLNKLKLIEPNDHKGQKLANNAITLCNVLAVSSQDGFSPEMTSSVCDMLCSTLAALEVHFCPGGMDQVH